MYHNLHKRAFFQRLLPGESGPNQSEFLLTTQFRRTLRRKTWPRRDRKSGTHQHYKSFRKLLTWADESWVTFPPPPPPQKKMAPMIARVLQRCLLAACICINRPLIMTPNYNSIRTVYRKMRWLHKTYLVPSCYGKWRYNNGNNIVNSGFCVFSVSRI